MITFQQEDNGAQGRIVLYEDDTFAGEITYVYQGEEHLAVEHTRVGEAFAGKGYGRKLLVKMVEFARQEHKKIVPVCSFVKKVFDRDTTLSDVKV